MRFLFPFFTCIFFNCLLFNNTATGQMRQVHVDTLQEGSDIQNISFYSASEGYVAFKYWIGFTSDSGRTFTNKYINSNVDYNGYTVNLTIGFNIGGIKAFNQDNIIVYGHYGGVPAILYSNNGGDTYTLVFHSQFNQLVLTGSIISMAFPQNGSIGYASDADRILKTTDGGLHWSVIRTLQGANFGRITAISSDTVFLGGNSSANPSVRRLTRTFDGGNTWTPMSLPAPSGTTLADCFFLNGTTGWVSQYDADYRGYFYKTTNSGQSWTVVNDVNINPFISNRMRFLDANTGYAILSGLKYEIYKTVNGGVLWEPLPRDNDFEYPAKIHFDLDFYSPTQFWAGGGVGFMELTTNGGGTPLPKGYFKTDTTGVYYTDNVQLLNFSKAGYQYSWYVNNVFVSNSYNATYVHNITRSSDTIKLVVSNGVATDTAIKVQQFYVPAVPVINSFFPVAGSAGTFITIKGKKFTLIPITGMQIGGTSVSSFTILTDTTATLTVGNGTTGVISFSDGRHVFSSTEIFTYISSPNAQPPVISSIQPASGPAGTVVTITGNNFGTDNIIYFGAVRGQVVTSTSTQINCIVPRGATYRPVFVLNTTTHLSGTSLKPFAVTFADSSNFTSGAFINAFNISYSNPTNFSPYYIKARDINNDGKPDLLIRQTSNGLVEAYKNTGTEGNISFGNKVVISTLMPNDQGNFDVNDVDGDGLPDIVAASNRTYFYILKNNSTPDSFSFDAPLKMTVSDGSQDVVITDLDNDGRNDIAIASFNYKKMSVLRNTGSPGNLAFGQTKEFNCERNANRIAAGDIDGDGKKDIVTLNYTYTDSTSISLFHNSSSTGNITFDTTINFIFPSSILNSSFISVLDYDNDGKLDIVALSNQQFLHVFRNTGTPGNISFDTTGNVNLQMTRSRTACIDNVSGDSKPDCLFAKNDRYFAVARNTSVPGSTSNDAEVNILPPAGHAYEPYHIDAGDFDLDGKIDIVICSAQDKAIAVYKNNVGLALPQSICANDGAELVSDIPGLSYQWQQDTGTGYHAITDNAHFSGINDSALQLINIPTSWYGYSYRCVVNNALVSQSYKLAFTNRFTGAINSNWNNPSNWLCQMVPDSNTDVLVTQGTLTVNVDAVCRSLKVSSTGQATVTIAPGVNFVILH